MVYHIFFQMYHIIHDTFSYYLNPFELIQMHILLTLQLIYLDKRILTVYHYKKVHYNLKFFFYFVNIRLSQYQIIQFYLQLIENHHHFHEIKYYLLILDLVYH